MDSIEPRIKLLLWDEIGFRALLEQLHAHQDESALSSLLPTVKWVVGQMAITFAQHAELNSPTFLSSSFSRTNGPTPVSQILSVLDFSLKMGGIRALATAFDRVLRKDPSSSGYVNSTLVPLLSHLRAMALIYHIALDDAPFPFVFQAILREWAKNILGPKPQDAAYRSMETSMRNWTCPCASCKAVRDFLMFG
jgi:hypothetical protein